MSAAAPRNPKELQSLAAAGAVIVASNGSAPFEQIMLDGRHTLVADEPLAAGGGDAGPGPYELLLMRPAAESRIPSGSSGPGPTVGPCMPSNPGSCCPRRTRRAIPALRITAPRAFRSSRIAVSGCGS